MRLTVQLPKCIFSRYPKSIPVTIIQLLLKLIIAYISYRFICFSSLLSIQSAISVLVEQFGYHEISVAYVTISIQIEADVGLVLCLPGREEFRAICAFIVRVVWAAPPVRDLGLFVDEVGLGCISEGCLLIEAFVVQFRWDVL